MDHNADIDFKPSIAKRGGAMLLLAAFVSTAHLVPGLDASAVEVEIRNSLHVIGFALVAAVLFEIIPASSAGKATGSLLVAAAIGLGSELAQRFAGSAIDIEDIYRDMAGAGTYIVARLIWSWSARSHRHKATRQSARVSALLIGMLAFGPLAYWMGVQSIARAAAPVILDFDSPWARFYFKPVNSKIALIESPEIDHGNRAEILFEHMYRSGMAVSSPAYNWTHYSELVFDAQIVSGKPTELTVHINDHERIGHFVSTDAGTFQVSTNSTEIRISIPDVISATGRDEDLSDIRQIVFLETKRRDGTRLRIDNIHLE